MTTFRTHTRTALAAAAVLALGAGACTDAAPADPTDTVADALERGLPDRFAWQLTGSIDAAAGPDELAMPLSAASGMVSDLTLDGVTTPQGGTFTATHAGRTLVSAALETGDLSDLNDPADLFDGPVDFGLYAQVDLDALTQVADTGEVPQGGVFDAEAAGHTAAFVEFVTAFEQGEWVGLTGPLDLTELLTVAGYDPDEVRAEFEAAESQLDEEQLTEVAREHFGADVREMLDRYVTLTALDTDDDGDRFALDLDLNAFAPDVIDAVEQLTAETDGIAGAATAGYLEQARAELDEAELPTAVSGITVEITDGELTGIEFDLGAAAADLNSVEGADLDGWAPGAIVITLELSELGTAELELPEAAATISADEAFEAFETAMDAWWSGAMRPGHEVTLDDDEVWEFDEEAWEAELEEWQAEHDAEIDVWTEHDEQVEQDRAERETVDPVPGVPDSSANVGPTLDDVPAPAPDGDMSDTGILDEGDVDIHEFDLDEFDIDGIDTSDFDTGEVHIEDLAEAYDSVRR